MQHSQEGEIIMLKLITLAYSIFLLGLSLNASALVAERSPALIENCRLLLTDAVKYNNITALEYFLNPEFNCQKVFNLNTYLDVGFTNNLSSALHSL